ncbi:peptidoglycan recognition protein family protein [Nonomuraea dietziae]|uniref:peptidoglycan recognition protein family protein n=1 Tax=Nonomuraea dietziae TaxID=65515 RepID=UPI00340C5B4A
MLTIPARHFHSGRAAAVRVIVVHTMESPEGATTAEDVARYFSRLPAGRPASAHLCVDNNSTVRCVSDSNTAFAAPGANADGLHIELAGRAGQTSTQWEDAYSSALLDNAARNVATWCKKYNIPARRITRAQLRAGHKGICGHVDVSAVYRRSDHWDPGPNFPWDRFINRVRQHLGHATTPSRPDNGGGSKPTQPGWPGRMLHYDPRQPLQRGHDVELWQKRLKQLNYTITVDGLFGKMSAAATKVLQRDKRLEVDGVVGPKTWDAAW